MTSHSRHAAERRHVPGGRWPRALEGSHPAGPVLVTPAPAKGDGLALAQFTGEGREERPGPTSCPRSPCPRTSRGFCGVPERPWRRRGRERARPESPTSPACVSTPLESPERTGGQGGTMARSTPHVGSSARLKCRALWSPPRREASEVREFALEISPLRDEERAGREATGRGCWSRTPAVTPRPRQL